MATHDPSLLSHTLLHFAFLLLLSHHSYDTLAICSDRNGVKAEGSSPHLWRKDLLVKASAEMLGTFFLCTSIGLSAGQDYLLAPETIGYTLMVSIYAFGHVSGAHFNPAVTVAVLLSGRNKIDPTSAFVYIVAQLLGSFIAASMCWKIGDEVGFKSGYPSVADNVSMGIAILVEMIYSYLLCSVVLNAATIKKQAGNSFFGIAIGFTVTAGAISAGPISGGGFNPAAGTALPGIHGITTNLVAYWLGPLLGSLMAAATFYLHSDAEEFEEEEKY